MARIVKAKSWKELPDVLEPGVIYKVDGVLVKPHERVRREVARDLVAGIKEMARHL